MPVTVEELTKAKRMNGKAIQRKYRIRGATSEDAAYAALLTGGSVPTAIGVYKRVDAESEVDEVEPDFYVATVPFQVPEFGAQPPSTFHLSFDIAGQSQRITQSRATVSK